MDKSCKMGKKGGSKGKKMGKHSMPKGGKKSGGKKSAAKKMMEY